MPVGVIAISRIVGHGHVSVSPVDLVFLYLVDHPDVTTRRIGISQVGGHIQRKAREGCLPTVGLVQRDGHRLVVSTDVLPFAIDHTADRVAPLAVGAIDPSLAAVARGKELLLQANHDLVIVIGLVAAPRLLDQHVGAWVVLCRHRVARMVEVIVVIRDAIGRDPELVVEVGEHVVGRRLDFLEVVHVIAIVVRICPRVQRPAIRLLISKNGNPATILAFRWRGKGDCLAILILHGLIDREGWLALVVIPRELALPELELRTAELVCHVARLVLEQVDGVLVASTRGIARIVGRLVDLVTIARHLDQIVEDDGLRVVGGTYDTRLVFDNGLFSVGDNVGSHMTGKVVGNSLARRYLYRVVYHRQVSILIC